jgi:hypothetical protein
MSVNGLNGTSWARALPCVPMNHNRSDMYTSLLHDACPVSTCRCRGASAAPLTLRETVLADALHGVIKGRSTWIHLADIVLQALSHARRDGVCADRVRMILNTGFDVPPYSSSQLFVGGVLYGLLRNGGSSAAQLRVLVEHEGLCPHACIVRGESGEDPQWCLSMTLAGRQCESHEALDKVHVLLAAGVHPQLLGTHHEFTVLAVSVSRTYRAVVLTLDLALVHHQWHAWHGRLARRCWCLCASSGAVLDS